MSDAASLHVIEDGAAPPILTYQQGGIVSAPPTWTHIRVFCYKPDGWKKLLRRRLIFRLSFSGCMVAAGTAYIYFLLRDNPREALCLVIVLICFFAGVQAFGIWHAIQKIREEWPTFRIVLADQGLFRTCKGYPDFLLKNEDIKRIQQTRAGLVVQGVRKLDVLYIMAEAIEGFSDIQAHLSAVKAIERVERGGLVPGWRWALMLAVAVGTLTVYFIGLTSNHLWVEVVCLAALLGYSAWSFWVRWRSPNVAVSQRLWGLLTLLLPSVLGLKLALIHGFLHFF